MKRQRTFPKNADLGAAAEQFAAAECLLNGLTVSWSTSDKVSHDFILDNGKRLIKIQVKGVFTEEKGKPGVYSLNLLRGKKRKKYVSSEVDYFIIYIHPLGAYYIFPFDSIEHLAKLRIYEDKDTYDDYKEAWFLLLD